MARDTDHPEVLKEFEEKFKELGAEASANGVHWLAALIYDDRFDNETFSTTMFSMPIHERIGMAETIKHRCLNGVGIDEL